MLGEKNSIHHEPWLTYDEVKIKETTTMIVVQVNGKVRGEFVFSSDTSEEGVKKEALALPVVQKWLDGQKPKKVIYVKNKLVSIVI